MAAHRIVETVMQDVNLLDGLKHRIQKTMLLKVIYQQLRKT